MDGLSTTTRRWVYTGDGVTLSFPYNNYIVANTDLEVYLELIASPYTQSLQTLTTHYSVTGVGSVGGGNVVFVSAPASTHRVVIVSKMPDTQPSTFDPRHVMPPDAITAAYNRLAAEIQQLRADVERSVRLSRGDSKSLAALASIQSFYSKYLYVDANGVIQPTAATDVAVSGAMEAVVLAATRGAAKDLLGVPHKHFVVDFGGVAGNSTANGAANDTAIAAAVTWANANGGIVYFPASPFVFNTVIPTLTKGGFVGDAVAGPTGVIGTVFRLNAATGDTVSIGTTGKNVTIRNILFWPVQFKTSGFEIHDRGVDSLIESCGFAYTWGAIKFGAGANGSSARRIRMFAIFGEDGILVRGTSDTSADWAQAISISDLIYYNPWQIAQPTPTSWKGNWATGTAYSQGDIVRANNRIWQAMNNGTSLGSGSGPTQPAYATSDAPPGQNVADNNINWRMIEHATSACIRIDSNSLSVFIDHIRLNVAMNGIVLANSLASTRPAGFVVVDKADINNTIADAIAATAGGQLKVTNSWLQESAGGRGCTLSATVTDGFAFSKVRFWKNALDGLHLPAKSGCEVVVNDCQFNGNGTLTADTYAGIKIPASVTEYTITNCFLGSDVGGGGTQKYGIDQGAGNDHFVITGNIALGNGTAGYNLASNVDFVSRIFDNNVGTLAGSGASVDRTRFVKPGGRLTLTAGTPVLAADVTAAATIYYAIYEHDLVPLFDGTRWTLNQFAELSLALDSDSGHTGYHQSGKNFDLFVYNDAGTLRLCSGPAWTSDTARADALVRKNGRWVNNASIALRFGSAAGNTVTAAANTALYVGTFRASANGQTEMSMAPAAASGGTNNKLYLWNAYNRVRVSAQCRESDNSWNYTSATIRAKNNSNSNRISFIAGLAEGFLRAADLAISSNSDATIRTRHSGVGYNATNAFAGLFCVVKSGSGEQDVMFGSLERAVELGHHFVQSLEAAEAAGTATWLGDNAAPTFIQTGLTLNLDM